MKSNAERLGEQTGREERRMRTLVLVLDHDASNVLAYLEDKYNSNPTELIVEALTEHYADDIEELERKEKMSDYGCCTLSSCNWQDKEGYSIEGAILFNSCADCPHYDPDFFKLEEGNESDN